jgi:hypothetical protein
MKPIITMMRNDELEWCWQPTTLMVGEKKAGEGYRLVHFGWSFFCVGRMAFGSV